MIDVKRERKAENAGSVSSESKLLGHSQRTSWRHAHFVPLNKYVVKRRGVLLAAGSQRQHRGCT